MTRNRSLIALVESAVMIALAAVLSTITLFKMPQGGSVTAFSMVPILLIGVRHGLRWGLFAGVVAGIVNYITGPYFVHPVQVLLDYPIAFGMLGLAGLAHGRSALAGGILGSLAIVGRFVAHVISGAIFFAEYAPEGQSPWVYSAIYNGTYMLPELLLSMVGLVIMLLALNRALPVPVQANSQRHSA